MIEDIIVRCINCEEDGYYQLYRYCHGKLLTICYRYNNNETDAVSALNQIYLKILKNLEKKKDHVPFDAWIKRIAYNSLIDNYRKDKKRIQRTDLHEAIPDNLNHSTDNFGLNNLMVEDIYAEIHKLKEPGRSIFNMVALEGFSHKEVAEMFDISVSNSKYYLHRSRNILKENLLRKKELSEFRIQARTDRETV